MKRVALGVTCMVLAVGVFATSVLASGPVEPPLADYVGFGYNQDLEDDAFRSEELQRQKLIQACMADAGFKYEIVDPDDWVILPPEPEPTRLENAQVHGLGVSLFYGETSTLGPVAVPENPNDAYVDGLKAKDRDAFYVALYGPDPFSEQARVAEGEPEPGCAGAAFFAVPRLRETAEALRVEYEAMRAAIATDPRVTEATRSWSACMAEAGFPFPTRADLVAAVDAQLEPLLAADARSEINIFDRSSFSAEQRLLLTKLQDYERAAAVSAAACEEAHLDAVVADVTFEHEAAFVDKFSKVLEPARR